MKTMMGLVIVVLVTLLVHPRDCRASILNCPDDCECSVQDGDSLAASCVTRHPQVTINNLPPEVVHLEMFFSPDVDFDNVIKLARLSELRFLLLDTQQKYTVTHKVKISSDTFYNNTYLEVFQSRVRLEWRAFDVFSRLTNITELLLSYTIGGWNQLKLISNQSLSDKTKLSKLYFKSFCEPGHSEYDIRRSFSLENIFGEISQSKIRELDISSNGLYYINSKWLGGFHYLEYLDISYNMICYQASTDPNPIIPLIVAMLFLPELKTFDVGHQGVYAPYKDDSNRQHSVGSVIQRNSVSAKSYNVVGEDKCNGGFPPIGLGQIRNLVAPALVPSTFPPRTGTNTQLISCFSFTKPNYLKYLDIQDNQNGAFIAANGWKSLVLLDLNELSTINLQNGGAYAFHESFFRNFPSLEVALLGGNNLGASLWNQSYFTENTQLQVLDLADNAIEQLPGDFFQSIPMLRELNVSGNGMRSWTANITNLVDLNKLNLSNNIFSNFSQSFRSQLKLLNSKRQCDTAPNRLVVDLQDNPLSCLCLDIDSVEWIQTTTIDLVNKEKYTCNHPVHGLVNLMKVDLKELKKYCFPDKKLLVSISALASSLCTLLLVLIVTLYCKRWHLRYWLYLLRKGWKKYHSEHDEKEYEYDVFVAHSTEDGDWVTGPLYDELEVNRGLRLCLYQRDILPNEILVEAIVDRIDKSRHTLLVLSPNFVASNWCHFEMHIAHAKWSEEGKDMIFPIILNPLSPFSVNRTLHYLLKRKVYLEWPSDTCRQQLFWERLASSLGAPERLPAGDNIRPITGVPDADEDDTLLQG